MSLKNTEISNRIPLSRFTKKDNPSLSMVNFDYDFHSDTIYETKLAEMIKKKEEEKPSSHK